MKLYKDGLVKELTKEKAIARLLNDGWSQEPAVDDLMADPVERDFVTEDFPIETPKRRGRPAKVA